MIYSTSTFIYRVDLYLQEREHINRNFLKNVNLELAWMPPYRYTPWEWGPIRPSFYQELSSFYKEFYQGNWKLDIVTVTSAIK